jgi:hypothetical protein
MEYMKKLILLLTLTAFALSPAVFAGDAQQCPFAKSAGDKKACCAAQAKAGDCAAQAKAGACPNQANKVSCQKGAQADSRCNSQGCTAKALSPKGAELALR